MSALALKIEDNKIFAKSLKAYQINHSQNFDDFKVKKNEIIIVECCDQFFVDGYYLVNSRETGNFVVFVNNKEVVFNSGVGEFKVLGFLAARNL